MEEPQEQLIESQPADIENEDVQGNSRQPLENVSLLESNGVTESRESNSDGETQILLTEFISVLKDFFKNVRGEEPGADELNYYTDLISTWDRYYWRADGRHGSVVKSLGFYKSLDKFILMLPIDAARPVDKIKTRWYIFQWSMFRQTKQGISLINIQNVCISTMGSTVFVFDMITDMALTFLFLYHGHYWQFAVSFILIYGAVTVCTVKRMTRNNTEFSSPFEKLKYYLLFIINWNNIVECVTLMHLEWKLFIAPTQNAHLIPKWREMLLNVAIIRDTEGTWEACPQGIFQFFQLLLALENDINSSYAFRTASVILSLASAGMAIINRVRSERISEVVRLSSRELILLVLWVAPVTVSRLLSVGLLLTAYTLWGLLSIVIHIVLGTIFKYKDCFNSFLSIVNNFISPFDSGNASFRLHCVLHIIHFIGNAGATLTWALTTKLDCSHTIIYSLILSLTPVTFCIGVIFFFLHKKFATTQSLPDVV